MSRSQLAAKGQTRRSIVVDGPDPYGSAFWDGLAAATAGELSSLGAPASVRYGLSGGPENTFYGDPGPIGGLPGPSYGARLMLARENASQALPGTTSPFGGTKAVIADVQSA